MPTTPDPSYWGNPPQTPTANGRGVPSGAPQQPMPQQPYAPTPQTQQQQQQAQQPYAQTPQPTPAPQYYVPQSYPAPAAKRTLSPGVIVLIVIASLVVVACLVALVRGLVGMGSQRLIEEIPDESFSYQEDGSDLSDMDDTELMNISTRLELGLDYDGSPFTREELSDIQEELFEDATAANGATLPAGIYYVGEDLPAGTYWFYGDDEYLSSFYVLQPDEDDAYNVALMNGYYGHNLMELEEGEVLILDNHDGLLPIESMDDDFTAPYSSGVYRVGVDVPAGTYLISPGAGADDYSACYVMSDLSYADESYLFDEYFFEDDDPIEITLEEGTYLELFNMTMTPADGTATAALGAEVEA